MEQEEEYVYTPLKHDEIRLLEILPGEPGDTLNCRLKVVSLIDLPKYSAVSYAWGEDVTDKSVWIDGRKLYVKPNLEAALLEFRREPPRLVPMDYVESLSAAKDRFAALGILLSTNHGSPESIQDCDQILSLLKKSASDLARTEDPDARKCFVDAALEEGETIWDRILLREGSPRYLHEPRLLWIDGVCINQKDNDERAAQVRLMATIFSEAYLLVIWLGLDYKSEGFLLQAFRTFSAARQKRDINIKTWLEEHCSTEHQNLIFECALNFLTHSWFRRTWIKQEYILGSRKSPKTYPEGQQPIVACCGTTRLVDPLSILIQILKVWRETFNHEDGDALVRLRVPIQAFSNAKTLVKRRKDYLLRVDEDFPTTSLSKATLLLRLLAETRFLVSTDPRDRIFSALGLVEAYYGEGCRTYVPKSLIISYGASVENVYSSFVKEIVDATNNLDILGFCTGSKTKNIRRTWVPDWSQRGVFGILSYRVQLRAILNHRGVYSNACPETVSTVRFSDDLTTMTVWGFVWDVAITKPMKILQGLYVTQERYEALNTTLAQRGYSEETANIKRNLVRCLMLDSTSSLEALGPLEAWIRNMPLRNSSSSSSPSHAERETAPVPSASSFYLFSVETTQLIHGSTVLFTKQKNLVRPICNEAKSGDLICILLGCAVPMLIRPVDGHYELLGEVFVPGIMVGEAMQALREGKVELQDFELH